MMMDTIYGRRFVWMPTIVKYTQLRRLGIGSHSMYPHIQPKITQIVSFGWFSCVVASVAMFSSVLHYQAPAHTLNTAVIAEDSLMTHEASVTSVSDITARVGLLTRDNTRR
jgi:hypothetical protein